MYRMITLLTLFSILTSSSVTGQYDDRLDYIQAYADIAVREMHRTSIPASIKLAQAMLESNAGKSELARKANNHFGIKCGGRWDGKTYHKKDDDYKNGRLIKSCFRQFEHPEASFIAHSNFLTDPRKSSRYGFLFELDPTDYKRWARGLKRSGYATNPRYDNLLIDLIERYDLHEFDLEGMDALARDPAYTEEDPSGQPREWMNRREAVRAEDMIQVENEVEYIVAREGETIQSLAIQFDLSPKRLIKYNERYDHSTQELDAGNRIYLQKKRRNYRGKQKFHRIEPGERMYDIAQQYGMRLDILYKRNRMDPGQQPAVGEQIRLRGTVDPEDVPAIRTDFPKHNTNSDSGDEAQDLTLDGDSSTVSHPIFNEMLVLNLKRERETSPMQEPTPTVNHSRHIVRKGDTLYGIASQYGISVQDLKRWNDLKDTHLFIGQQLIIQK